MPEIPNGNQRLFFELINKERKNKTSIYPLSEIKQINPKEVSPFIGRESINKLKELGLHQKRTE
jgi:hypothetical protein